MWLIKFIVGSLVKFAVFMILLVLLVLVAPKVLYGISMGIKSLGVLLPILYDVLCH